MGGILAFRSSATRILARIMLSWEQVEIGLGKGGFLAEYTLWKW